MIKRILRKLLTTIFPEIRDIQVLQERAKFVEYQVQYLGMQWRSHQISGFSFEPSERTQTKQSFDYQWKLLNQGSNLAGDEIFAAEAPGLVSTFTGLEISWFPGKRVLDLGCGAGRFSRAMLAMGAQVTSADQSPAAVEQTTELCNQFRDRHQTMIVDILNWETPEAYDLVFCYGVTHHTGNTYKAIINASNKVRSGGRLFLMIYGYPNNLSEYQELNTYDHLRQETAQMSFDEKVTHLRTLFPSEIVHGYFDAISPRINDLLSFEEIYELLRKLGFNNIRRTYSNRNHHLVADRN